MSVAAMSHSDVESEASYDDLREKVAPVAESGTQTDAAETCSPGAPVGAVAPSVVEGPADPVASSSAAEEEPLVKRRQRFRTVKELRAAFKAGEIRGGQFCREHRRIQALSAARRKAAAAGAAGNYADLFDMEARSQGDVWNTVMDGCYYGTATFLFIWGAAAVGLAFA